MTYVASAPEHSGQSVVVRSDWVSGLDRAPGRSSCPSTLAPISPSRSRPLHEQSEVQRFRRELYAREVRGGLDPHSAGQPQLAALEAYHRWTGPDGPTALSPCMARPDSATRSHCQIEVRRGEVRFQYLPSAPFEGADPSTTTLPATAERELIRTRRRGATRVKALLWLYAAALLGSWITMGWTPANAVPQA